MKTLHCIVIGVGCLSSCNALPAQNVTSSNANSDVKPVEHRQNQLYALYDFEKTLRDEIKSDPAKAVEKQQAWVAALKEPRREVIAMAALHAGDWLRNANDKKGSWDVLQKAFLQLAGRPEGWWVTASQIRLLAAGDKHADAETLAQKYWAESLRQGCADVVLAYVDILESKQKYPEARAALKTAFLQGPLLLETDHGTRPGGLYDKMIASLHRDGKEDEAVSWAKLRFMQAPFNDAAIKSSTDALTRALLAKDMAGTMAQGFLAAQKDTSLENPLAKVPLPFTPEEVASALAQTPERTKDATKAHARLNLLIAGGFYREAFSFARQVLINNPGQSSGAEEICRVFKAMDLNLKRGNDFITYLKSGQGANPVTEYYKGTEPAASSLAVATQP